MPDPTAPAPQPVAQMGTLPTLLAGLLGGFLGPQGSMRRFVFGVAGFAVLALNHKLGLGLDITEQGILSGLVVSIVLAGNGKDAIIAHADAKVQVAQIAADAAADPAPAPAAG